MIDSPKQRFARLLWRLAELDQANSRSRSFRARAYRRAVWSLDRLSADLNEGPAKLLEVPGIGPGIVKLIEEFRQSGRLARLEGLEARLPREAPVLGRITRITPTRLHALKSELGVETVEDLQDAIDLGRLQQLIGVGPKTAQYWLRAIGEQREGVPIYRALDYANELIALLGRTLPEVNVEVAGALRRLDEWIVEIELAASDLDSVRSFLADSAAVAALPVPVTVTGPKPRDERPGVVAMADLRGDLHCHSDWSPDGRQTLSQLVRAAADRGYEYVGITDHAIGLRFGGLDADRVNAQRAEIVHLRAEHPSIKILHGMELNIDRDGSVDFEEELLEWLDYTVAGAHSLLNLGRDEQTTRMLRAVSNPQVDIIAHLTGRRIGIRPAIELDLAAIFSAAREHGTALEVNGHLDRLDLSAELIGAARKEGVLFAANSDAHRVSELSNAGNAVTLLQRGGAPPAAVINCLDLESLRRKL